MPPSCQSMAAAAEGAPAVSPVTVAEGTSLSPARSAVTARTTRSFHDSPAGARGWSCSALNSRHANFSTRLRTSSSAWRRQPSVASTGVKRSIERSSGMVGALTTSDPRMTPDVCKRTSLPVRICPRFSSSSSIDRARASPTAPRSPPHAAATAYRTDMP
eukprot:scaffold5502_cov115-Isochrysis_galbana.AAC.5